MLISTLHIPNHAFTLPEKYQDKSSGGRPRLTEAANHQPCHNNQPPEKILQVYEGATGFRKGDSRTWLRCTKSSKTVQKVSSKSDSEREEPHFL